MKTALLRLLSSMKFWTLLLGIVTSLGAKYGLEVDPEVYWSIVGLFGLLIGAQGLNDHGKAKAEIETRSIQSGFFRLDLLVIVFAGGSLTLVACSWLKSETKHVAADVVDCTTDQALAVAKEYAPSVELAVRSQLSDVGKLDHVSFTELAKSFGTDAGRCVLARVVARLLVPSGNDSQSTPLAVDTADVAATWEAVRASVYGGQTFQLGGA